MRGGFVGEIGREKDDGFLGGVGTDFFERLEGADVDAAGGLGEEVGGLGDGSGSGFFAFGRNDGSAALALGLGLFGHGAFHVGGELDVLKTDAFDVDTPFVGLGVDNFADLGGNLVAFAKDLVEVEVAGDVTKGGLGESAGRVAIVCGFEDSFLSVDNAGVDDGIDIDGDVVAGDNFLFRDVHWGGADVDFKHFVDIGDDDAEAGIQGAGIFPEAKDNAAFVLVDNTNARNDD